MKNEMFHIRNTCRLCASTNIKLSVPLNPIPVISPNISDDEVDSSICKIVAPLDVYSCEDCGLMQLTTVIDPHLQYDTFMYETSVSLGLSEHFSGFVNSLCENTQKKNFSVLEIGSNDGTLLQFFKNYGAKVVGVDPARSIAQAATQRGIPTYGDFYTETLARQIVNDYGKFDYIISNNTLANIDDLTEITLSVKNSLETNGLFIFETQYALDVLEKNLLDVIYHEHLSYFSVLPLTLFFKKHGLEVVKVDRINPKGGSIRVFVQIMGHQNSVHASVHELIELERKNGLYNNTLYTQFTNQINVIKEQIHNEIQLCKSQGNELAIYGSSVGCASLINQFSLGEHVSFIVDDKPFKKGLMGPSYDLPIVDRNELAKRNPALVIVLAWRYINAIKKNNQIYLENGGRFMIPLPNVSNITSTHDALSIAN